MARRLRVLHIIDSLGLGGAQSVVENIVRCSDRERFQHEVTSLHGAGPYMARLRNLGVGADSLADSRSNPLLPWKLVRRVREFRPHVVHAHLLVSVFLAEKLRWFFPRGTAVFSHLHNDHGATQDFPYQKYLEAVSFRGSNLLVACSGSVAQSFRNGMHRHAPIRVVRNGVDDALLRGKNEDVRRAVRAREGVADGDIVFLSACRLASQKNLRYALEVFAALTKRRANLRYWIAGTGEEKPLLKQRAKDLGVDDAVRFLDFRDDVPDLMQAADFYLMPSLFEGLPMGLVEAMGSLTPPIVTPFSVTREMIRDGRNGIVIPFKDAALAAVRIAPAMEDAAMRERLGRNAANVAVSRFSASQMTARMESLYLQAARAKGWRG
ncbi:glycosyltransferase family 1 protein [soil metagenome]